MEHQQNSKRVWESCAAVKGLDKLLPCCVKSGVSSCCV